MITRHDLMRLASPGDDRKVTPTQAQKLWLITLSGMVERYHNIPTITRDTVGEHTYGVLWMVTLLHAPGLPRSELMLAALAHDTPEVQWGDITAPTKRLLAIGSQYRELERITWDALGVNVAITEEEHRLLKLADCLDAMLHCCYERAMGNQMVSEVFFTFYNYIKQDLNGKARFIADDIIDIWRTFDE